MTSRSPVESMGSDTVSQAGTPLQLAGIAISYGIGTPSRVDVVDGFGLDVHLGEVVCLAGRSGSGKTSILGVAAGLRRPRAGSVRWGGVLVETLSDDQRADLRRESIGLMLPGAGLMPLLTAEENVALAGAAPHGEAPRTRVARLLDSLSVGHLASRYPGQLSRGEQQRVALARAMYMDPPLYLIDEPTANLDRATADTVVAVLANLAEHGRSVVVASHDPILIEAATRVVRLELGTEGGAAFADPDFGT